MRRNFLGALSVVFISAMQLGSSGTHLNQITRNCRLIKSNPKHRSAGGHVHHARLRAAIHEFDALQNEDTRLLVASDINVDKWLRGTVGDQDRKICYEIEFRDHKLDTKTNGDLYIVKRAIDFDMCLGYSQLFLAFERCKKHPSLEGLYIHDVKGCILKCLGRLRVPDFAVYDAVGCDEKISDCPCLIVEFETERRSLCVAHKYCSEYFGLMPALKAVILFKYFALHPETLRFAAVAVLYRRAANGSAVSDAVSFGTCSPPPSIEMPEKIAGALRILTEPPSRCYGSKSSFWTHEQRPFLSLPLERFLGHPFAANSNLGKADASGTLVIDLWKVLKAAEIALINNRRRKPERLANKT
jgi:hypothetical protein